MTKNTNFTYLFSQNENLKEKLNWSIPGMAQIVLLGKGKDER